MSEELPLTPVEPAKPKTANFLAQLSDPKFGASIVTCVMLWLVYRDAAGDPAMTSADKRDALQSFMLAVAGIFSTTMAALGYQAGKLNEGTVPEGNVPAVPMLAGSVAKLRPIYEEGRSTVPGSSGRMSSLLWLFGILAAVTLCSGCVGTSRIFQETAKRNVDHVAEEMGPYVANNQNEAERAAHAKELGELQETTAVPIKKIDAANVAREWRDVDPIYREYVAEDQTLNADDKAAILKAPESFNGVIHDELTRQNAIRQRLFLPPHPVP